MNWLFLTNISKLILLTLQTWNFWNTILSAILIIFIGFILTKKNIFKKNWDIFLTKIIMLLGLPSLAFHGFMTSITMNDIKTQIVILLLGFLFYLIMWIFVHFFYFKCMKNIKDVLSMCTIFSSTTFFGTPIIISLYKNSILPINIFNIPYRIFLYSLGYMVMSKINSNKINIKNNTLLYNNKTIKYNLIQKIKISLKYFFYNPILIATILGFVFWLTQLIPGIKIIPRYSSLIKGEKYLSPFRFDNTFPPFFQVIKLLSSVCTPLVWLTIGIILSKGDFKTALKNKIIWWGVLAKVIIAPIIGLFIGMILIFIGRQTNIWQLNKTVLGIITIMSAAPPASVIVSYSINFNKEPLLASNLTLVSTLFSIISLPFWIIVVNIINDILMI